MLGVVNYAWGWKWAYIASVSTTEVQFKRACKGYFILCHLKKITKAGRPCVEYFLTCNSSVQ